MEQLKFPKIEKIQLSSFSLYSKNPDIEFCTDKFVTCLAGANGIGKSTFLATLNFALTGAVPLETKNFKDAANYTERARKFTHNYFEGRINENSRENACISIWFTVGDQYFFITRGIFDGQRLRSFSTLQEDYNNFRVNSQNLASEVLENEYKTALIKAIGLNSFDQFIFLQHFIFTFDESRDLLFWSERSLDYALTMAFGEKADIAEEAEQLERKIDKTDSLARNKKYAASQLLAQATTFETFDAEEIDPTETNLERIAQKHDGLENIREELIKKIKLLEKSIQNSQVKYDSHVARIGILQREYDGLYKTVFLTSRRFGEHPVIRLSIENEECDFCGSEEKSSIDAIKKISKSLDLSCPICGSSHENNFEPSEEKLNEIQMIDEEIFISKTTQKDMLDKITRLQTELKDQRHLFEKNNAEILNFIQTNQNSLSLIQANITNVSILQKIEELKSQAKVFEKESKNFYQERNKHRAAKNKLLEGVALRFNQLENSFTGNVRALAESFIGLDIDVRLIRRKRLSLALSINNDERNAIYQLSESQRFFLDIALRMSIARHLSDDSCEATLLIDTPEGSLDIAYEHRAGEMFAKFVEMGHSIIMTANINTSELLNALAETATSRNMKLVRMTDWAELSDVQLEQEHRFNEAYDIIESRLVN